MIDYKCESSFKNGLILVTRMLVKEKKYTDDNLKIIQLQMGNWKQMKLKIEAKVLNFICDCLSENFICLHIEHEYQEKQNLKKS